MALPLLFNNSDCGPSNPLQSLSKQFDRDRGIQQDHFGSARAGSSREAFRSENAGPSNSDQEAASKFFSSAGPSLLPHLPAAANAYEFAAMKQALSDNLPQQTTNLVASSWAADFAVKQLSGVQLNNSQVARTEAPLSSASSPMVYQNYRPGPMLHMQRPLPFNATPMTQDHQISWDKEFASHDLIHLRESMPQIAQPVAKPQDGDELARTAGLLLEAVSHEQNPKFKQSSFLGLMQQLRDREVVVEGDKMVPNDSETASYVDVKGKGRVGLPHSISPVARVQPTHIHRSSNSELVARQSREETLSEEDNYWRQENAEYTKFWDEVQHARPPPDRHVDAPWAHLQDDWDRFEADHAGIRSVTTYQFQENNPYLLGQSSRTRNHSLHDQGQSLIESVLELEATVQRNTNSASAWFELGVKQQENEREQKALQALERSVQLDPEHLPTWLALAVSQTNDNNRSGTYEAIHQWAIRNTSYRAISQKYQSQLREDSGQSERFDALVECLLAMARSSPTSEVDADMQIALAVLFNNSEDYQKAQDCFRAALAVRPDDWLLYNRVGATMANNGQPEVALQYYYRALELNPLYIRARYNLGISCINLRKHDEAVQHILHALQLQDSDGLGNSGNDQRTTTALWDSLKTACIHLQRVDLAMLCDQRNLEEFQRAFQE